MARISTYTTDSSIDGTEFLLGREADGTTKQFSLSALQTYLATVISSTSTFTTTIVPNADDSLDIGSSAAQWKDLYIDGIAYIDQLGTDGDPVASAFISGGEIDGVQIGGESPSSATFTDVNITGQLNFDGVGGAAGQVLVANASSATPTFQDLGLNGLTDVFIKDDSLYIGDAGAAARIGNSQVASKNIAIGATALNAITTGDQNIAIGYNAGGAITTTSGNIAIGVEAGASMTSSGGVNILIGGDAGKSLTSGSQNIAIGSGALDASTVGDENIAIGINALGSLDTAGSDDGDSNTVVGSYAGMAATSMDGAVLIGFEAGTSLTTGDTNVFVGSTSGAHVTVGKYNTALGGRTLMHNLGGIGSVAIGHEALRFSNTTAGQHTYNTAVGFNAGKNTTTGTNNTFVGSNVGIQMTTGGNNTAVGAHALLLNNVGTDNVAIGESALRNNVDGSKSVAVGTSALESQDPSGANDLHNVAVGSEAGQSVTTGGTNTIIGSQAGDVLTTGSGNTALGYDAAFSAVNAENQTVIGNRAVGHGNNIVTIGNTAVTAIHPGQSGTADLGSSSYKFKDIFIDGFLHGDKIPTELVTVNDALTSNQSGKTFVFNDADGAILTLPDSGAGNLIGVYYDFVIAVTATSGAHKIVCADTTNEKLFGQLHPIRTDASYNNPSFAAQAGDNFSAVTCNGTTTGIIGSTFRVQNIAADKWIVSGDVHVTGSPSTPFATS